MSGPDGKGTVPAGIVVGSCPTRLWGLDGTERARRVLAKIDATVVETPPADAPSLLVRADWVVDGALLGQLKAGEVGTVLVTNHDGGTVPLAAYVAADDAPAAFVTLAAPASGTSLPPGLSEIHHDPNGPPIYLHHLRKRLKPVVMPLTDETVRAAEAATFKGAYKDVTDIVTKYLWPFPARRVTRWCTENGITPNMVTMLSFVLVFVAMWCFWKGWFAAGLAAAWTMTFLDTVDGKLARCTFTFTRFGGIFDHGIDLISPPFWWWAWHVGCLTAGVTYPAPELTIGLVNGGYVILRLQELLFKTMFGMHIHVWRRSDSMFRLIVARRNPLLVILTVAALLAEPGWGMVVSAAWTVVSVLVHTVQITQALAARRTGPVISWLNQ